MYTGRSGISSRPRPAVLDIGAGTGRDAAWFFAALGCRILAVEPTVALRVTALELHSLPLIECVDDGSPELAQIARRHEAFDPLLLTAVWMR
jgi:protein-L-isoaspartate O-methyltransferase